VRLETAEGLAGLRRYSPFLNTVGTTVGDAHSPDADPCRSAVQVLDRLRQHSLCLEHREPSAAPTFCRTWAPPPAAYGCHAEALLAFMPEEERDTVLQSRLERLCVNTIVDADALQEELAKIRIHGYAASFEEN
jgi:DNA-binding IclR family transcriptional regulator